MDEDITQNGLAIIRAELLAFKQLVEERDKGRTEALNVALRNADQHLEALNNLHHTMEKERDDFVRKSDLSAVQAGIEERRRRLEELEQWERSTTTQGAINTEKLRRLDELLEWKATMTGRFWGLGALVVAFSTIISWLISAHLIP